MKNKLVIQITEPIDYSEKALAVYRSMGRVVFDSRPLKDAEVLVVGLKHQIDKKWIDAMPLLEIVASPATGLNHLDYKYLRLSFSCRKSNPAGRIIIPKNERK